MMSEKIYKLLSNAKANFSKPTVCTLQKALIINTKNFARARFQPFCSWKMETNLLLLGSTLDVISLTERRGNLS